MESHAEIKDKCDDLETRLDELAVDIRDLPFKYSLIEKYTAIDEEMYEIYKWYEEMRDVIKRYEQEKPVIEERLQKMLCDSKTLNNEVQNLKLQIFSHDQHEVGCSP
jgi:predicted nuclease with TOPRIM domain